MTVKEPLGVFNVYATNTVRDTNVTVDGIDEAKSGLLTKQSFESVRLVPNSGRTANAITVD